MFCPECGTQIKEGSKFCIKCGHRIEGDTKKETTSVNTPPTKDVKIETPSKDTQKPESLLLNKNVENKKVEDYLKKGNTNDYLKIVIGIVLFIVFLVILSFFTSSDNPTSSVQTVDSQSTPPPPPPPDPLQVLYDTSPSDLQPDGELNEIFDLPSDYTDVQRENKEREIKGKIVQWNLRVYEVHREGDKYRITTGESDRVGTVLHISPRSSEERQYIESLKTDDRIEIKGYIKGIFLRSIEIDPCILPQFRNEEQITPISKGQFDTSKCIKSEQNNIILSGKLERFTYPFMTSSGRQETETGLYLSLNNSVCYEGDELSDPKQNISLIQLVLDENGYDKLNPYLGKIITLKGNVFGSHTGHHHTPILLEKVVLTESVNTQEYIEYCNKRYGFCFKYPSNFKLKPFSGNGEGQEFYDDKGFSMSVSGINNITNNNLKTEMNSQSKNFDEITYQTNKNNWFVLSGYKGSNVLYLKTYVGKSSINNLYIQFPSNQKNEYNDIVTKISKSFKSGS